MARKHGPLIMITVMMIIGALVVAVAVAVNVSRWGPETALSCGGTVAAGVGDLLRLLLASVCGPQVAESGQKWTKNGRKVAARKPKGVQSGAQTVKAEEQRPQSDGKTGADCARAQTMLCPSLWGAFLSTFRPLFAPFLSTFRRICAPVCHLPNRLASCGRPHSQAAKALSWAADELEGQTRARTGVCVCVSVWLGSEITRVCPVGRCVTTKRRVASREQREAAVVQRRLIVLRLVSLPLAFVSSLFSFRLLLAGEHRLCSASQLASLPLWLAVVGREGASTGWRSRFFAGQSASRGQPRYDFSPQGWPVGGARGSWGPPRVCCYPN